MTTIVGRLDASEARTLTDDIKRAATLLGERLLTAYEREAWAALGYTSWREYAVEEFGIAQSRAYQLLAQTRVIIALGQADSTIVEKLGSVLPTRSISQMVWKPAASAPSAHISAPGGAAVWF